VATLQMLVSFVVVLGVLIVVHELGHFLMARLAGVGVERFSVGFGPVLWRFRGKETEYCVSAIPMGGYVKMMGDDENPLEGGRTDTVDPRKAFNLKPVWVRFLIVFAGPGMNFVLAVLLTALAFMAWGRPVVPAVVGRVADGSAAAQAGIKPGDRIVAVDGRPIKYWDEVLAEVQASKGRSLRLTVTDGGATREVAVAPQRVAGRDIFGDEQDYWDLGARQSVSDQATIGDVVPGGAAAKGGLKPGDIIVSLESHPIASWDELADGISTRAGKETVLGVKRGEQVLTVTVTPTPTGPDGRGRIGISHSMAPVAGAVFVRSGPLAALREGGLKTWEWTQLTVKGMYKLITVQLAPSNIGGPIQIAAAAGEQARQGLPYLTLFTALISVNLAVLNLLPVPMLDGGHLLFFVCEAVLGRPISVRKREIAQQVGFVLLMMLMVYAVYNDLSRLDVFHRFFR
jgi:regulator of sigma E protease